MFREALESAPPAHLLKVSAVVKTVVNWPVQPRWCRGCEIKNWCRGAGSNRRHRVFQLIWRMSATVRRRPFRDQLGVRLGGNCPLLSASVRLGRGVRWGSSRQLDTGTQYAESALAQGSDHAGRL